MRRVHRGDVGLMRFRKTIEIGVMLWGPTPFLPKMQVGQWVTVFGGRAGRWVGLSRGGIAWIVWPRYVGALRTMADAYRRSR